MSEEIVKVNTAVRPVYSIALVGVNVDKAPKPAFTAVQALIEDITKGDYATAIVAYVGSPVFHYDTKSKSLYLLQAVLLDPEYTQKKSEMHPIPDTPVLSIVPSPVATDKPDPTTPTAA